MHVLCLVSFTLGLCAVIVDAQSKSTRPDFSGKWVLNLEKSKLQIPPPTSSLFEIDHREPDFRLTRTHVYGDRSDTITMHLTTDGTEYPQQFGELKARTRLYWEGPTLILDMTFNLKHDKGTNVVRYSLKNAGRTLVSVEKWRSSGHSHDNLWVFDRR
jgi:hypothetical protein